MALTEEGSYKKPHVSVSYGFGNDNRYHLSNIPESIQLAIYKYDIFVNSKKDMFKELEEAQTDVRVVHLPLDSLKVGPLNILGMINELNNETGCCKFVIHPNKTIKLFLDFLMQNISEDIIICVENFEWRKGKELRSPLQIIEFINTLRYKYYHAANNIKLCIDTSHTEEMWFDHKLMSFILPHVDVIHLSNRFGRAEQHMPFNSGNGDLNLVGFVKELISKYRWSGDIVLEYMPVYHYKLFKNAEYLKKLINCRS